MDEKIYESLYDYNEHEQIYKELYQKKQEGEYAYQNFLKTIHADFVQSEHLWIPELMDNETKKYLMHMEHSAGTFRYMHDESAASYVRIWKHNRYTPPLMHAHRFYECIYVYEGQCCNVIDARDELMSKGDFCIIPPNTPHSIWAENDGIVLDMTLTEDLFLHTFFQSFSHISILSDFLSYTLKSKESTNYVVVHSGSDERISNLCIMMYQEYYYHRKFFSQAITGLCQYMFSLLLRNYQRNIEVSLPNKKKKEKSGEIFFYIQQHFTDIDLNSTAEYFNYSPSYFSKLIKKMTGKTFITLVTEYRLSQGCNLLSDTNYSVADISDIIGYPNVEHFNRIFKQVYGQTPTQYRCSNKH